MKPIALDDLPNEILLSIAGALSIPESENARPPSADLFSLSLASTRLSEIANTVLYGHIVLQPGASLVLLLRTLRSAPHLARLARRVSLCSRFFGRLEILTPVWTEVLSMSPQALSAALPAATDVLNAETGANNTSATAEPCDDKEAAFTATLLAAILVLTPAVRQINLVSNALGHCETQRPAQLHGQPIATPEFSEYAWSRRSDLRRDLFPARRSLAASGSPVATSADSSTETTTEMATPLLETLHISHMGYLLWTHLGLEAPRLRDLIIYGNTVYSAATKDPLGSLFNSIASLGAGLRRLRIGHLVLFDSRWQSVLAGVRRQSDLREFELHLGGLQYDWASPEPLHDFWTALSSSGSRLKSVLVACENEGRGLKPVEPGWDRNPGLPILPSLAAFDALESLSLHSSIIFGPRRFQHCDPEASADYILQRLPPHLRTLRILGSTGDDGHFFRVPRHCDVSGWKHCHMCLAAAGLIQYWHKRTTVSDGDDENSLLDWSTTAKPSERDYTRSRFLRALAGWEEDTVRPHPTLAKVVYYLNCGLAAKVMLMQTVEGDVFNESYGGMFGPVRREGLRNGRGAAELEFLPMLEWEELSEVSSVSLVNLGRMRKRRAVVHG